jgi:hypothetical protein
VVGVSGPPWPLLSRPGGRDLEAHPDDPKAHDLTVAPEFVFTAPRISVNTGEVMALELPDTAAPAALQPGGGTAPTASCRARPHRC